LYKIKTLNHKPSRLRKLRRVLLAIVIVFLCFVGVLLIPATQTLIGQQITQSLENRFETKLNINKIKVSPFGYAVLNDILAIDHKNDTLLYVGYARTSVLQLRKIIKGNTNLGDVLLRNVDFNVVTHVGDTTSNVNIFFKKFESDEKTKKADSYFDVSSLNISNVDVSIQDKNENQKRFLSFIETSAILKNFSVRGDTIQTDIEGLQTKTNLTGKHFTSISGSYKISPTQMSLSNATIKTSTSSAEVDIALAYPLRGLKSFADSVQLHIEIERAAFGKTELKEFIPDWPMLSSKFSGNLNGTLKNFNLTNASLTIAKTQIEFDLNAKNIFDSERQNLTGNLRLDSRNLTALIPEKGFASERKLIAAAGLIKGKFGFGLSDKVWHVDTQLETSLGEIDINGTYNNSRVEPSYRASLSSDKFDVGTLTSISTFGSFGFNMVLNGKGIDLENLVAQAKGELLNLEYRDYIYDKVSLEGNLTSEKFNGKIVVFDKALDLDLSGQIDFASATRNFSFTTNINNADFSVLGWFPKTQKAVFSGAIDLALQGNTLDEMIGDLYIERGKLSTAAATYSFSSVAAQSRLSNNVRLINISSEDVASGLIVGEFKPSELIPLVQNALGSQYKNFNPHPISPNQYVDFNFNIKSKIASAIFGDVLALDDNTFIKGKVNPEEKLFKLNIRSPKLGLYQTDLHNIEVQVDTQNPLYHSFVSADRLENPKIKLEGLNWINTRLNDKLFGRLEFVSVDKPSQMNQFNTAFTIDSEAKAVLEILTADFYFNDSHWFVETDDSLPTLTAKSANEFSLSNLTVKSDSSLISVRVDQNGEDSFSLGLVFEKVNLKDILSYEKDNWGGVVDGFFNLHKSANRYGGNSNVSFTNLALNDISIGNAFFTLQSQDNSREYELAFRVEQEGEDVVASYGILGFKNYEPNLNLTANFNNYSLSVLEGLTSDVFRPFNGLANGTLKLTSTDGKVSPKGTLYVENLTLGVPYLNTVYQFEKAIPFVFEDDKISIHDAGFNSAVGQYGTLTGLLQHQSFSNWGLDMHIDAENLQVVNTSFSEDALYYGDAFFSGDAHLHGPFANMQIDVLGQTAPGTSLFIPLQYDTAIGDVSYINFVQKQSESTKEPIELAKVNGLQMNFDLDVTADAEVEIVVDPETKSSLRGKGAGNLLLEIDTAGSFAMWGDFIALEGQYNFKNLGLIDKTFRLRPGGTIVWEGDPLGAQINMQAVYEVPGGANPAILLEGDNISQKIPTEVTINLFGNLLDPETPTFEIDFPNASGIVKNELNYRLNDQERRQLQAISLLSQGAFVNEVSLSAISSQTLTNNLFQKASGVFDNIFTSENDKLNLSLDYLQGDRNAAASIKNRDRLGVSLSTNINERILIDGKVGIPVESEEETTIIGDVKLEFLLNKQGTLRARVFNKENEFQYFGDELGYTQGLGVSYLVRFDSFDGLIQKIFNKKN
jgi:hypothetical protein